MVILPPHTALKAGRTVTQIRQPLQGYLYGPGCALECVRPPLCGRERILRMGMVTKTGQADPLENTQHKVQLKSNFAE